jgi:3-phosphoglycerate kinase
VPKDQGFKAQGPCPKLSIKDLDLNNQRAFIRVDFNVPIKDGKVDGRHEDIAQHYRQSITLSNMEPA